MSDSRITNEAVEAARIAIADGRPTRQVLEAALPHLGLAGSEAGDDALEQAVTDILFALGDRLELRDGPDVDEARHAVMAELNFLLAKERADWEGEFDRLARALSDADERADKAEAEGLKELDPIRSMLQRAVATKDWTLVTEAGVSLAALRGRALMADHRIGGDLARHGKAPNDEAVERWTIRICQHGHVGRCGSAHCQTPDAFSPVEVVPASLLAKERAEREKAEAEAFRLDNEAMELAENFRHADRDLRDMRDRAEKAALAAPSPVEQLTPEDAHVLIRIALGRERLIPGSGLEGKLRALAALASREEGDSG